MDITRAECSLGDDGGRGHAVKLTYQDDGSLIIESFNPDSREWNRITLVGGQPRLLKDFILRYFGAEPCAFRTPEGLCLA